MVSGAKYLESVDSEDPMLIDIYESMNMEDDYFEFGLDDEEEACKEACGVRKEGCMKKEACGVSKEACGVKKEGCMKKEACGISKEACGVRKEGCSDRSACESCVKRETCNESCLRKEACVSKEACGVKKEGCMKKEACGMNKEACGSDDVTENIDEYDPMSELF